MAALCLGVSPICFTVTAVICLWWGFKHMDFFIDEGEDEDNSPK